VPAFAEQVSRVQSAFWIQRPLVIQLLQPLLTYSGSVPLACLLVPLALIGLHQLWRTDPNTAAAPRPRLVVLGWLTVPIALPFLLSYVGSPIFLPKYTIAASVPFMALVAYGALGLPRRWRTWSAIAVGLLSVWSFGRYYSSPRKDGWRPAVAALEEQARPNDLILFYPWFNQMPFSYYQRRTDLIASPFVANPEDPPPPSALIPALAERAARGHDRAWLVVLQGTPLKSEIVAELARVFAPPQHTVSQHIELYLFEKVR
jgi:hypothetical protein